MVRIGDKERGFSFLMAKRDPHSWSPFLSLYHEEDIVRIVRNDRRYETLEQVRAGYLIVGEFADQVVISQNPTFGWLYDLRGAPLARNDPEFERVNNEMRAVLTERSPYLVALVKTHVGMMQMRRMRSAGPTFYATNDEADARAWLKRSLREASR